MSDRRGFTLIELLLSLFMMVIVAAGLYSLMVTVYRVTRKQTEVSNLQGNLRAGMQLVQSELQELYVDAPVGESDLNAFSATAIDYDGMRGIGETCGVSAGLVKIRQATYSGREPKLTRDRLLLFQDRDTVSSTDDAWVEAPITGVGSGTCSVGVADASWDLTVPGLTASDLVDGGGNPLVFTPGPARTTEQMEMGLVTDGGQDWLGIRSISSGTEAALIPVIGPLVGGGVQFKFYDGANAETAVATAVKQIRVTLWGITAQSVNTGMGSAVGSQRDSMVIRVQLRNSR